MVSQICTRRAAVAALPVFGVPVGSISSGDLAYGYLPFGASSVELIMPDGTSFTTDVVLNLDARLWGAPIQPGTNPASVRYVDNQGRVVNDTESSE